MELLREKGMASGKAVSRYGKQSPAAPFHIVT
jgi:hypothetical protein